MGRRINQVAKRKKGGSCLCGDGEGGGHKVRLMGKRIFPLKRYLHRIRRYMSRFQGKSVLICAQTDRVDEGKSGA